MFSIIGGRISLRGQSVLYQLAFTSGEVKCSFKGSSYSTIPEITQKQCYKLTTVVSGFAKPKNGRYIPGDISNGQVGEDAYFKAQYSPDLPEEISGNTFTT